MVDERQVFDAADALQAQGKLVSVRSVRVHLGRRGSNRDLGPLVTRWKVTRSYKPRISVEGVPLALQNVQDKALADLWTVARSLASEEFGDERNKMRMAILASDEVRDEALQEADRLTDEVSELRSEVTRLRALLERRTARVERMRSEDFWTRTMQEIFDLMPSQGSMTVEQILSHLGMSAWRETANQGGSLTASVLRKKMRTRATHGKFFVALDDGSFKRRGRS